jgi:hypothetical protein
MGQKLWRFYILYVQYFKRLPTYFTLKGILFLLRVLGVYSVDPSLHADTPVPLYLRHIPVGHHVS